MTHASERKWNWLRWSGWGAAVALVATPFVLMKAVPESGFAWTGSDFALLAILVATVGLLAELAVRASGSRQYRLGAALAAGSGLLLIWSNLAAGYIGDGDARINVVFLAIPAAAMLASVLVKGRASAMMWIMLAAALAHGAAGVIGYPQDTRTGPITIVFVGLWLGSAALFRTADRRSTRH